jgi:hypothetical protein
MTFEQWWAEKGGQWIAGKDGEEAAREFAKFSWNAALNAAQEMMLRCCCGHPRSEHINEECKCTHENCTCIQLCDCWVIVSELREEEQPGTLAAHFAPLLAK